MDTITLPDGSVLVVSPYPQDQQDLANRLGFEDMAVERDGDEDAVAFGCVIGEYAQRYDDGHICRAEFVYRLKALAPSLSEALGLA